ncbi:MAG: adenosylmethionine decarboxylase [Candidatus Thermoplasmatota archaeon]|nr:adenosylmethionine decarboxylase [Candidatus Thermoplasmatota archaeon]
MKVAVGFHILADLYGIDERLISSVDDIYPIVEKAVVDGNLTKISSDYYQFKPVGASGIVLLAESHLSFHTWPEHGLVTMDIYTCGNPLNAERALDSAIEQLKPQFVECRRVQRGTAINSQISAISAEQISIPG